MAKQTNKNKISIESNNAKPLTLNTADLKQSCWDYILELEARNPQTVDEFGECNLLDDLLQSYFTWKIYHTENGLELSDEMGDIEDFITKYLKRFYACIHLEELKSSLPAFQVNDIQTTKQ